MTNLNEYELNAELTEVVRLIRPLPETVQPSESFVAETRAMLEDPTVVSLSAQRRRRAEERERRKGRSAA